MRLRKSLLHNKGSKQSISLVDPSTFSPSEIIHLRRVVFDRGDINVILTCVAIDLSLRTVFTPVRSVISSKHEFPDDGHHPLRLDRSLPSMAIGT